MSDLISREYMKSLGATCIASRSKDGNMFPIVAIDELPSVQSELANNSKELDKDFGECEDAVSRQAAIEAIWDGINYDIYTREVKEILEHLPSVQPRKGKWINHLNDDGHHIADCSECGHAIQWFDDEDTPKFCCLCGSYNGGQE